MEAHTLGNPRTDRHHFMRAIVMCTTCRYSAEEKFGPDGRSGGETLIAHMRAAMQERGQTDLGLQTQACLWNCKRHCSVILRDDQRFTYFTGDHQPSREQAEAILDWFAAHGETETGEVPFRQWPDRMRGHFIARIPPVQS